MTEEEMIAVKLILYFIGSVIAYLIFKRHIKNMDGEWTVGGRKFTLFIALFSWDAVFIGILVNFIEQLTEGRNSKKSHLVKTKLPFRTL